MVWFSFASLFTCTWLGSLCRSCFNPRVNLIRHGCEGYEQHNWDMTQLTLLFKASDLATEPTASAIFLPTRPTLEQFESLKIRRSAIFMQIMNIVRPILMAQSSERVGRIFTANAYLSCKGLSVKYSVRQSAELAENRRLLKVLQKLGLLGGGGISLVVIIIGVIFWLRNAVGAVVVPVVVVVVVVVVVGVVGL